MRGVPDSQSAVHEIARVLCTRWPFSLLRRRERLLPAGAAAQPRQPLRRRTFQRALVACGHQQHLHGAWCVGHGACEIVYTSTPALTSVYAALSHRTCFTLCACPLIGGLRPCALRALCPSLGDRKSGQWVALCSTHQRTVRCVPTQKPRFLDNALQ